MKTASITRTAFAVVVVLGLCGYAFAGQTIYVDDNAVGSNDGSSWADAYNYLQDALADANSNSDINEIRVAQGTYKPDLGAGITPGDREATFLLIGDLVLLGGYAGVGHPDPDAQDIQAYETILSGDLSGNDVEVTDPCDLLTEPTRAENSYHVVTVSLEETQATLDGFLITGGNANLPPDIAPYYNSGGGLRCMYWADIVLRNCTFHDNSALQYGGALLTGSDSAVLLDCAFSHNAAEYGGAVYFGDCYSPGPVLTGCTFSGNSAREGGAIFGMESNIVLTQSTFSGNSADFGGALYSFDGGDIKLANCTLSNNTAQISGGGIYGEGIFYIDNTILWGNTDPHTGGEPAQITVYDPVHINYSCVQGWTGDFGGIGNIGNEPLFIDADGLDDVPGTEDDDLRLLPQSSCLDAGDNDAVPLDRFDLDGDGDTNEPLPLDLGSGDRFTDHPGTPDTGNPGVLGGPIVDIGAYEGAGQGFFLSTRLVIVPEQGTETFTVALAQDPLQTVPVIVGWTSGDIDITVVSGASLTFDSSNYSEPQSVILTAAEDIDNLNGSACIGISAPGFSTAVVRAIEADNDPVSNAVLYVDADAPGVNNGSSWAQAYTELRDALTIAALYPEVVEEIRMAQGVYTPGPVGESAATFQLISGVAIYGGYAGFGQPDPNARDIQQYETVLSGDLRGDDIDVEDPLYLHSDLNRLENSYRVVTGSGTDATAALDGLTITGGDGVGSYGGGMYIEDGIPTLNRVTFSSNYASGGGSGVYNLRSSPLLTECTFIGNSNHESGTVRNVNNSNPTLIDCAFVGNYRSGMRNVDNSNPQLTRCLFSNNEDLYGGAMYNSDSSPTLTSCMFIGNSATSGGGMYSRGGSLTLVDCTFTNNSAKDEGGGLWNRSTSFVALTLTNCTFINNSAGYIGGGIFIRSDYYSLINCKFHNNYAVYGGGGICSRDCYGLAMATHCTFTGNTAQCGGGMDIYEDTILLTGCLFSGNHASNSGGGLNCTDSDPTLINCTFNQNFSDNIGAGMYNHSVSNPMLIINCIFGGNKSVSGGGIYNHYSDPILTNCTLSGNSAQNDGAGIYNFHSDTTLTSCIIWGNTVNNVVDQSTQIYLDDGATAAVNYSCIQGWTGSLGGIGNIGIDPCFVELGYWDPNGTPADANDDFWVDGDYHLLLDSPCIDTGDNTAVPPSLLTDLDGRPRIINGTVDMSAYEFWGPVYVDDDAQNDPGPGDPQVSDPLENGTESHPFDTIQEAIDLSVDWYTVLVRQGSYFEPAGGSTIDFLGKNITLKSEDPTDWDIIDNTIIRSYVQFNGTEDPNCTFAGFKIRNIEGAIYGNHTHATISHCNISGNGPCGATVIQDCDGTISNCLITDNTTFFFCGVYPVVFECNGLIKNCTIANNESGVSVGTATIENCIIYNNGGPQLTVTNGNIVNISYSNVQDGLNGVVSDGQVNWGPGNIDTDPCFVRLGYWITDEITLIEGDYHLKSEGWRWNTEDRSWTYNYTTSRCVDAGNPGSPLLGELMSVPRDPDNVWGINLRINMGAFGGTSQASLPPHDWALLADLNNDGTVNFFDFAYQTRDWLVTAPEQPGDLNRDGVLSMMDLGTLAEEWLQTTIWIE